MKWLASDRFRTISSMLEIPPTRGKCAEKITFDNVIYLGVEFGSFRVSGIATDDGTSYSFRLNSLDGRTQISSVRHPTDMFQVHIS